MTRDGNHTVRYFYIKSKRSYRDNVKPHTYELWNAAVNLVNATARTILGFAGTLFGVAEELCLKGQKRWVTKDSIH